MSIEFEALKDFFGAVNRNDMQAVTKDFDAQIELSSARQRQALSTGLWWLLTRF
jgi:hypothetical protein